MLTKKIEKHLWASVLLLLLVSAIQGLRAQCPAPTHLVKDSTTATHVYWSWQAAPGVSQYQVSYITPSDTLSAMVAGTHVSFPLPVDTSFEIVNVLSLCPGGGSGEDITIIHGGIVITIVDIFSATSGCDSSELEDQYVFFEDLCVYCKLSDLCTLKQMVGPLHNFPDEFAWQQALKIEMNRNPVFYNIKQWKGAHGCYGGDKNAGMPSIRLASDDWVSHPVPNPFLHSFSLSVAIKQGEAAAYTILDAAGRRLDAQRISNRASGVHHLRGLGRTLPKGLYLLVVQQGDRIQSFRLIKH